MSGEPAPGSTDPIAPDGNPPGTLAGGPADRTDPVSCVIQAWALAVLGAWAAWRFLPADTAWVGASLVWLAVPVGLAVRRDGVASLGLLPRAPLRSLLWTLGAAALVLPAFAGCFLAWNRWLAGPAGAQTLAWSPPAPAILWTGFVFHLARAGIPEEVFFRGFAQARLAQRFPGGPRLLLMRNAPAVALTAALFAVTHVVFLGEPLSLFALGRLATFFPGLLFGILRERAGDVWAPAAFHALCNAWLAWLIAGYQ